MKKFLAMAMTGVMVMSMGATAFAADPEEPSANAQMLDVSGDIQEPVVEVTIPTNETIVINPYQLAFDHDNDEDTDDVTHQVYYVPDYVYNTGAVDVIVDMTVSAEVSQGVTLLAAPSTKASTSKDLFLFTEVSDIKTVTGEVTADTLKAAGHTLTGAYEAKNPKFLAPSAKGPATQKGVVTLPRVAGEDDSAVTSSIAFQIGGQANGKSEVAWDGTETATVKVVFDFLPTVAETGSGS